MSTRALRWNLEEIRRSSTGAKNVLIKRYEMYAPEADQEEAKTDELEREASAPHANEHPIIVMGDESTGNTYESCRPEGIGDGR